MTFYSVHKGNKVGIFNNWNDCNESINGFKGAVFKKFDNKQDAEYFSLTGIEPNHEIDNFDYDICVYTDGGCINNGSENAIAGIGIYFGENDTRNVCAKLKGKHSNNTAEMSAILKVLDY